MTGLLWSLWWLVY